MIIHDFSLPILTKWKRTQLLHAASKVLETQHKMIGKNGKNLLHYTLKKKRRYVHMNHYPKGDRIDYNTGSQYFYHCHRENFDTMEHGHFHCFMRYNNISKRIKPATIPKLENASPMTHLVAIAMNSYGQPIRLFTVNRWISLDIWYDAKHMSNFVKRFKMTLTDDPYWQILDQWVTGIISLFSPQIIWLQNKRDQIINEQRINNFHCNVYDDHNLEEISEISIDLNQQIQWVIG